MHQHSGREAEHRMDGNLPLTLATATAAMEVYYRRGRMAEALQGMSGNASGYCLYSSRSAELYPIMAFACTVHVVVLYTTKCSGSLLQH
mmetsp:Transcript_33416/g.40399  ORF Transcript_33416/g.40399 Transcript_33416/m.40399 type:complete len:89 (-) Transcript_33416:220-486(-)